MNEALDLYRLLWPTGYGEIRSYSTGARSRWCVAQDEDSMTEALVWAMWWSSKGSHVAAGVNPRCVMRHPCGRGKDVPMYHAAVLDFDHHAEAGVARTRALGLEPSVLVHSGRGMHVYLLLDPPVEAEVFRPYAKALCDATGSDPVHDPGRILRVPGTSNPRTQTVARVVAWEPSKRYSLETLRGTLPTATVQPSTPSCGVTRARAVSHEARERGYPSRSEGTMAAANWLMMAGLSECEALARLLTSPLAARSRDDVLRVVTKVYQHPSSSLVRFIVRGVHYRGSGTFLKIEVIRGAYAGQSWSQRVDGVEPWVEACLGADLVTPQEKGGDAFVSKVTLADGAVVPRIRVWIPKGERHGTGT